MPGGGTMASDMNPWNWKDNDWTLFIQVWLKPEHNRGDFRAWFNLWHPTVLKFGDEDLRKLRVEEYTMNQIEILVGKRRSWTSKRG